MTALAGRVAIVTGATSGIGAATAVAFAGAGADVVVSGRSAAGADATVAEAAAHGTEVRVHLGDIAEPAYCDDLIAFTVAELGRVDVLANVAGTISRGDAPATADEDWRHNMRVNVDGVFFASRAAVRAMRSSGRGGAIVNLASNVGLVGAPGLAAYCASKGAVVLLTKAMALDHAAEGIRVNALCPGAVDTPMLVSGHPDGTSPDDVRAANVAAIPEGRIPAPAEIAESMVYLASDASRHVTGVALPIDGGYVAG